MSFKFLDNYNFIPFAHHGGSHDFCENTLEAFNSSINLGYRHIETDVRHTKDKKLVIFHDPDLKRVCGLDTKIENLRVIKGTNFDYFSEEGKKLFYEKEFIVSKLSDRMGMRLEGPKIDNIVNTNIKSEGLIKGVIQVPADGNPIIMLSDHGTIGGYPKIGVVASVDYDRLVQMSPGSKIKFKEINLSDAETLFKLYEMETQNLLSQI